MATAVYVRTTAVGSEPDGIPSTAEVALTGVVASDGATPVASTEVTYWPSLIAQWGKAGVRAFVEAEALDAVGATADAHSHLDKAAPGAPWAAQWQGDNPVAPAPDAAPAVDPLA